MISWHPRPKGQWCMSILIILGINILAWLIIAYSYTPTWFKKWVNHKVKGT
jgi:hypothetical protein